MLNTPSISDHRLLRAEVKLGYVWQKPKSTTKKYNISALKNIETATTFQLELTNRFLPLIDALPTDIEEFSDAVNNNILETASKITCTVLDAKGHPESNKKDVRKKHGDSSTQYKIAKAETKKLVKRDKINQLNDDLDEISNLPPDKQFFLAMKKLKTRKRNISWGIKDEDGKLLT